MWSHQPCLFSMSSVYSWGKTWPTMLWRSVSIWLTINEADFLSLSYNLLVPIFYFLWKVESYHFFPLQSFSTCWWLWSNMSYHACDCQPYGHICRHLSGPSWRPYGKVRLNPGLESSGAFKKLWFLALLPRDLIRSDWAGVSASMFFKTLGVSNMQPELRPK